MDVRFSRKKVIVRPSYQIKLAITLFVYISVYSLILGFVIFYPLYTALGSSASMEEQAVISSIVLYLHKRIWVGLLAVAVLAGVHSIYSSHKVVGPAIRFRKILDELVRGNYTARIRIRKGDEFKELEVLLNELADTLERSKAKNTQSSADLTTRLEEVSAMLDAEGAHYPQDVRRILEGAITELKSMNAGR